VAFGRSAHWALKFELMNSENKFFYYAHLIDTGIEVGLVEDEED